MNNCGVPQAAQIFIGAVAWQVPRNQAPGGGNAASPCKGPDRGIAQPKGQLPRVAWCGGSNRSHSKSDGPKFNLTQFQPGTPGRFLGGNALSGFFVYFWPLKNRPPAGSASPGGQARAWEGEEQALSVSPAGLPPLPEGEARKKPEAANPLLPAKKSLIEA